MRCAKQNSLCESDNMTIDELKHKCTEADWSTEVICSFKNSKKTKFKQKGNGVMKVKKLTKKPDKQMLASGEATSAKNIQLLKEYFESQGSKPNAKSSISNYRLIIGESPYNNTRDVVISNIKEYAPFNKEVAFLCNTFKAPLFFVFSILCGSHDRAKDFINYVYNNSISMSDIAEWLFVHQKILLVNRNDKKHQMKYTTPIINLIQNKSISKVLILGNDPAKTSKKLLKFLSNNTIQYEQIVHPSPRAYAKKTSEWCELYLKLDDSGLSSIKYVDFRIQ